ncbi:glycosyltransferase family 4 protein [Coleofasciculus sp. LEGE 07081]|uniref:glycosyltransferase family 4 protein n=1 Tax=unclassified Coleofasciculus TaxID=2692782 RepID=UPI001882EA79|nr:glycosyltransferase family 4 protein [Coleofasciculus sp. LEGE 07081]MBE9147465.1 glycosyltransferase family 4 protein [Coleofasciculus sp. LEGE 07092]
MHVIALENEPSSFRGGQELSLLDVCRGLDQQGHSISLLYEREGDLLEQFEEFCVQMIEVSDYRINRSKPLVSVLKFLSDIRKVTIFKNSIVYSNHYHNSLFGYTLALSKNIPFVCHIRLPPPKIIGWQWTISLRGANQLIAVSKQTKLDWIKRGFKEKKIEVVYNSINLDKFNPLVGISKLKKELDIPEDTQVISYVGRLDREKGLETLIKGFALLLKSGKTIRLLIVGKPLLQGETYKRALEQLSISLGVEKHINFLGHVTNPNSLYQISDLTVLPSLHSEPFGRTILESMACGTPVAASRTGGIPEILTGEFQIGLFEPGDEKDLSNVLNRMLHWRDSNPKFSNQCREYVVQNFSLGRTIESVEKLLLETIKNKNAIYQKDGLFVV